MAIELDPPRPDTPAVAEPEDPAGQTPSRAFASARRGYDRKEVDDFLDTLVARVGALEAELVEARAADDGHDRSVERSGDAAPPDGGELGARLTGLFAVVEREASSVLAQAKTDATAMVAEAATQADRIRAAAREEAGRSIEEARAALEHADAEAARMLLDISVRRQQLLEGLQQMQERLMSVAQDLDRALSPAASASGSGDR